MFHYPLVLCFIPNNVKNLVFLCCLGIFLSILTPTCAGDFFVKNLSPESSPPPLNSQDQLPRTHPLVLDIDSSHFNADEESLDENLSDREKVKANFEAKLEEHKYDYQKISQEKQNPEQVFKAAFLDIHSVAPIEKAHKVYDTRYLNDQLENLLIHYRNRSQLNKILTKWNIRTSCSAEAIDILLNLAKGMNLKPKSYLVNGFHFLKEAEALGSVEKSFIKLLVVKETGEEKKKFCEAICWLLAAQYHYDRSLFTKVITALSFRISQTKSSLETIEQLKNLIGADLSTSSDNFDGSWQSMVEATDRECKESLLNMAGYYLDYLGSPL